MSLQNKTLLLTLLFTSLTAFSAVTETKTKSSGQEQDDIRIMEELTGQKIEKKSEIKSAANAKNLTTSQKHLVAGESAFSKKEYAAALKHYNTVIVKNANRSDVKKAYLSKAKLYTHMGLNEQASLNKQIAEKIVTDIK